MIQFSPGFIVSRVALSTFYNKLMAFFQAMHIAPEWSRHTNKKTSPNQGGKQRGIDFYFKSNDGSKPAVGAPNSGGGARQAKKNKKFPNKGSRIQH